jgi:hypothetical protein
MMRDPQVNQKIFNGDAKFFPAVGDLVAGL